MGTVKKITLMMALVTGSITADVVVDAVLGLGQHDMTAVAGSIVDHRKGIESDLRMLNAKRRFSARISTAEHKELARVVERGVPSGIDDEVAVRHHPHHIHAHAVSGIELSQR